MFQHLLVPLDGSARAERALSLAVRLAEASGGVITLLRVVSPEARFAWQMRGSVQVSAFSDTQWTQANTYLTNLASSPELAELATITEVANGDPAQLILDVASSQSLDAPPIDLIIICSHGETGLTRWTLGSVAQKVARQSPVPVLILQEKGSLPESLKPEGDSPVRVLVGLDGSDLAEAALAPAAYLSASLSAPSPGALHLVRVVRLPVMYEYGQQDGLAEAREQGIREAQTYLTTIKQRLHDGAFASLKLSLSSSVVVNMDIALTLIGIAEGGEYVEETEIAQRCDVMALATHGRSGIARWLLGSVTERILGTTALPLLVVRPTFTASVKETT